MQWLEWTSTLFTLIYLFYAIRNDSVCFYFAIVASVIWTYLSADAGLYSDAGLQVFYIIMACVGLYTWSRANAELQRPITHLSIAQHLYIVVAGCLLSCGLYTVSRYSETINYAALDAVTTVFLIIGTILLIYRKIYSWIYLVVADFVYIYIYHQVGLHVLAGTMLVYSIFGIYGFLSWRRLLLQQKIAA